MSNPDQHSMTELMFRDAVSGALTLEEARKKLHTDAYLRTAAETLAKYCGVPPEDSARLRKKVTELLLESDPAAKKDSVDRKVRTWINDRILFISRKSALQIAFALHLPVKDTEEMLWRLCGEGFHWRNPEDIVWTFALDRSMSYTEACALSSRMAPVYKLPENLPADQEIMTETIRLQVARLQTEAELEAFLKEFAPRLGSLHNTAYRLFTDFMELLKSPEMDDLLPGEKSMTAGEIVTTYLYNHLIPRMKKENGTRQAGEAALKDAIQRDIQQNWPDEYALARMSTRETDVTRKVLILLFLACDGGETSYGEYSDEETEDLFEDTYARLSSMLADCGFAPLDSRIPFDWMVLYCLVADDMTDIDENILNFLTEIFRASGEESAEE